MAWFRMMGVDAVEYHRSTVLGRDDDHPGEARRYYGSRGETPLEWGGSLAGRLGLEGRVDDDGYDAMYGPGGAVDPHLGQRMVQTRRPGVELVVSAHKSVAVLGVMGAVDDMHSIVDAETDATMEFLDAWFGRQGGPRGRAQTRTATSGLLWARTRHLTTRAGDPEPHDHVLIANITEMLDDEGGWKALDTGGLRDLVHAATMVGRLAAAERAVQLGYAIEPDQGRSGKLGHWRLAGIPDEVLTLFSKRGAEIDTAMESEGFDTYRARGIAARRTRDPKADYHEPDLWHAWRDELAEAGIHPQDLRRRFDYVQRRNSQRLRGLSDGELSALAARLLDAGGPLAQRKAFTRADVIRAAAPELYGYEAAKLDRAVAEVLHHPEAIALVGQPGARGRAWATASVLQNEDEIAATAGHLASRTDAVACQHLTVQAAVAAKQRAGRFELTDGPVRAARAVLTSGRSLDVLVGVAGSGKTTALDVVRLGFESKGHRVIGTATSGQAARGLREGAGVESFTVASLVNRLDHGRLRLDERTVLLVDEVGMTDDRSMRRLLRAVEEAGAKVVVIGDHRQLSAVGPGGGLEALIDRHPEAVHVLDENIRQHDHEERQALEALRTGDPADAVRWYTDSGRLIASPTRREAIAQAVAAWNHDRDIGKESVLLAWRCVDVAVLNQVARADQIARGQVTGPEVEAPGGRRYAVGDEVVLLAPDREGRWVTSERGGVEEVDGDAVVVRFDGNRSVTLTGPEIDDDHLDHAYAVTVHRMQGATVDTAHVLADGGGRELAYVAMSRARETTHIHTRSSTVRRQMRGCRAAFSQVRRSRDRSTVRNP